LDWTDEEYVIGPGVVVNISVLDLVGQGQQEMMQRVVGNSGYVKLDLLPYTIRIADLTAEQAREVVVNAYKGDFLQDPMVNLDIVVKRQNYFNITGMVARPNVYQITRKDFRLLDALTMAGDVTQANLEYVYVIRQTPAAQSLRKATPSREGEAGPAAPLPGYVPPPGTTEPTPSAEPAPSEEVDLMKELEKYLPDRTEEPSQPQSAVPEPGSGPPSPSVPSIEPTEPATKAVPAVPAPTTVKAAPTTLPASPADESPSTQDEDDLAELRESLPGGLPAPVTRPVKPTVTASNQPARPVDAEDPFGWTQANMSHLVRVIAISLPKLKAANPRQNIIIRDGDTILIPSVTIGEFYVAGEVPRPGVYSLTGRKLTVKMALTAAGGLGALAWPSNAVLTRRIGEDQELRIPLRLDLIMAGKEPEILIKPDDVIEVGSHIATPFLAVARNAFRMTYGFGFIYDRNFAETNFGQFQGLDGAANEFFGYSKTP
ncbi:MAG: SLBB domain-containing protein, partial [Planctomycetes bacterium]|nr:SLBB domain-containing protein [Planctomycetota bacterium]